MRVVENHRKEALFRQMLEYRRASHRETARANALESQRRNLEACFRSVEACWTQVRTNNALETVRERFVC